MFTFQRAYFDLDELFLRAYYRDHRKMLYKAKNFKIEYSDFKLHGFLVHMKNYQNRDFGNNCPQRQSITWKTGPCQNWSMPKLVPVRTSPCQNMFLSKLHSSYQNCFLLELFRVAVKTGPCQHLSLTELATIRTGPC